MTLLRFIGEPFFPEDEVSTERVNSSRPTLGTRRRSACRCLECCFVANDSRRTNETFDRAVLIRCVPSPSLAREGRGRLP